MYPKVALYDPSGSGGITHYTFELAEALDKIGCPATIITSEDYELRDLNRGFGVWFLFKKSLVKSWLSRIFRFMAKPAAGQEQCAARDIVSGSDHRPTASLIGRLKSLRFTLSLFKAAFVLLLNGTRIVHFQWIIDRRADLRFMRLLRLLGFKVVYTVHNLLPHDEYTAENQRFYQRIYRIPDRLIVHSEANRKEMLDLFSVDADRISVIPHGCQTVFFDYFNVSRTAARRDLGIPDDTRVILFFGVIKPYKGVECLLKAFETIDARCENVMLLIAGRVADNDPDIHRHYSTLLARYSTNPHVRFKDEYVPLNRVAHYFAAADLVILPHTKASQSGVLLTACAAGKPVVVTDTGGLSEVVKNGENGFVVPPNDSGALSAATVSILSDPEVCERFGRDARRLAATTFSWTAIGRTTAELYHGLVHAGGAVRVPEGEKGSVREPNPLSSPPAT